MKKSSYFLLPIVLIFVISAVVLPLHKVYADATADEQLSATYVQKAQAYATAAATAETNTQQCVSQNNPVCATAQVKAATADANAAQAEATKAQQLVAQDASSNAGSNQAAITIIEANASRAESAASEAASSAEAAAAAAGETNVAQSAASAAQQSSASANSNLTAGQITSPNTSGATTGGNFVPLTNFPAFANSGLTGSAQATDLATFFNNLYKICIGFAAALAFLQIVRAGFTWMTAGDNTEQVSHARSLITNSVFGLLLVLSPVIVFTIINPAILNLNLNFGQLGGTAPSTGSATVGTGASSPTGPSSAVNPSAAPGTTGAACTKNTDCTGDTAVCNYSTGACEPDGPNVFSCIDDSAANPQTGLCANGHPPTNIDGNEAPAAASATSGQSCAGNKEACTNGNVCNDQTSTCTAIPLGGSVGQGGSCAGNVNACSSRLTCDTGTHTCIP